MNTRIARLFVGTALFALGWIGPGTINALAVPSYSRQTGLPCETCHTVPPQLTAFGRYFRVNGYVLSANTLSPTSPGTGKTPSESISQVPPISAMIMVSNTILSKAQPGTQNSSVAFPQSLSLYYAGRIAPHIGTFLQMAYDAQSDHFSFAMADLRYANFAMLWKRPLTWGITLNNIPTFGDPWNSTPGEGFPAVGSDSAPGPSATPMIIAIGGNVLGLGTYGWYNDSIYAGVSVYRSAQIGASQPLDSSATNVISNVAPYWRLAWERNWNSGNYTHSWEIGTFGMSAHLFPGGGQALAGATDNYLDVAVDSQYQLMTPNRSSLTARATFIHEKQTLNASDPMQRNNHLNTLTFSAQYYWWEKFGPTVAYFNTTGNTNAALYGNQTASPDSNGWILQWTYLPAQNIQLGVQYTLYNKFDGASSNYDGTGRSASDNNTLYLFAWFMF